METEQQVVYQLKSTTELTIKGLYHLLAAMHQVIHDGVEKHQAATTVLGEQNLYKLMNATDASLDSVNFQKKGETPVDLNLVRDELNKQGFAFAFQQNKDGSVTIFFKVKDQKLAKNALRQYMNGIGDDIKQGKTETIRVFAKDPQKQNFEEKMAEAKAEMKNTKSYYKAETILKTKGKGR
jgi:hypothetical protein